MEAGAVGYPRTSGYSTSAARVRPTPWSSPGAAGAVGSVAGQIAKIKGCRVIGVVVRSAAGERRVTGVRNERRGLHGHPAINGRGGPERWEQISRFRAAASITGAIWALKGKPGLLDQVMLEGETPTSGSR